MDVKALNLAETGITPQVRLVKAEAQPVTERPELGKDAKNVKDVKEVKDKGPAEFDEGTLNELTAAMNKFMSSLNADLQFELHKETKQLMVKMVDVKTQTVLREFPSREFLDTIAKISESIGAFLDKKV